MGIFNALKKVRTAASSLRRSGGSPANTPTAATDTPIEGVSPALAAQIESARIIEKLVELFGIPQQSNRLEISEDRSPSSKFDNVLNTSNLLGVQSEFIDSIVTPIGGYYGIILRPSPSPAEIAASQAASTAARGTAALAGARSLPNSAWGLLIKQAYGTTDSLSTDVSESEELEQLLSTETLKFPQYYVFIFSNLSPQRPIPLMVESDTQLEFENITAYPKATVTNINLRIDDLQPGTMIRVEYDGVDNKTKPVISEIVEDDPAFLRIVMNSMKNRSSLLSSVQCSTDSALTAVSHPEGDAIGVETPDEYIWINENNRENPDKLASETEIMSEPEPEPETLAYTQEQLNDIKVADLVLFTSPVVCGGCVILEEEYFDIVGITTAQIQMFDPIHPKGGGTSGESELPDDNGLYNTIANNPDQGTGTTTLPTLAQYQGGVLTFISKDSATIRSFIKNIAGDN